MNKEELIEEFYQKINNTYNISIEELNIICSSPFRFLKDKISEGILIDTRFQYFGKFEVNKPMVKYSKKVLEEKYSKGEITEKRYKERLSILQQIKDEC